MAVFFVGVSVGFHIVYSEASLGDTKGVLGGPSLHDPYEFAVPAHAVANPSPTLLNSAESVLSGSEYEENEGFLSVSLVDDHPAQEGNVVIPPAFLTYTVKKGDTLSRIAVNFGVSQGSLRSANPNLGTILRVGEEIVILTNSGIVYEVKEGDTLQSIAATFSLPEEQIQELNPGVAPHALRGGTMVVLPPTARSQSVEKTEPSLPRLPGYYMQPATGFNWGRLHSYNAVDIANSCGSPVVAAAEGIVVSDDLRRDGTATWNGGYGRFVYLEHPNGTKTRYAHLENTAVTIGDYVEQGERIGSMGNSGNTHGITGCHLHFEVYGAENPFTR